MSGAARGPGEGGGWRLEQEEVRGQRRRPGESGGVSVNIGGTFGKRLENIERNLGEGCRT